MITINCKYAELIGQIHPALTELSKAKIKHIPSVLSIAKVKRKADEEIKTYWDLRKELAERLCSKNDQDQPVIDENNNYVYPTEQDMKETNRMLVELFDQSVTIQIEDVERLNINDLQIDQGIEPEVINHLIEIMF